MTDVQPLDPVRSLKTKLGLLVVVSVLAVGLLVALGTTRGVPWWLTLPVSGGLALGVTQLLAAGMTQPLRQMTEVATRMARGDYAGRVHTQATDEVGRLAAAFNEMAEDLATVDRERRDLLATVSHELRTPLTAMTALLENLADGVVPADREHLDLALAQAERLRDLVADLLELSRLEAGLTRLDLASVEVQKLVSDCIDEVRAAGRSGDYEVSISAGLAADVDPARLRQLLVNVLDNAGRHAPVGTSVQIEAGETADGWWLEVADAGPGVVLADREQVFDRFGTDPDGGGTGVGLAVARWVAQLHGGTLRFIDPRPTDPEAGLPGARLHLALPRTASFKPIPPSSPAALEAPMNPAPSVPQHPASASSSGPVRPSTPSPEGSTGGLLDRVWPDPGLANARLVGAAVGVGLLAGATMAFSWPGLSWSLVLLAAGATAFASSRHRRGPFTILCTVLAALLVLPVMLLDALWISVLCVLASGAIFLVGATRGRTVLGFVLGWLAWPLAPLRGLPWLTRSIRLTGSPARTPAVLRTIGWSLLGVAVFGLLFASADALFASWVDWLVPDLRFGDLVLRGFVAVAVFGLTLAGGYVGLNPPRVELTDGPGRTPLRNRFEWLAPVLLVNAVFLGFLAAQATAAFGGHEYLERSTGITYADYVHQGFGQLTVATALTLLVVWATARFAGRTAADLRWLRISLGLLCLLTLVVVASALFRMHVYQQAYGFTSVRLIVDVFEGWLGVVVLAVMITGVFGGARWMPRIALMSGALALLLTAAINPDAWVAERNIDRYQATGQLDAYYIQGLSADAVPVIAERLSELEANCVLRSMLADASWLQSSTDLWSWNLGRERAANVVEGIDMTGDAIVRDQGACRIVYDLDGASN